MNTLSVAEERFHISVVQSDTNEATHSLDVLTRSLHPIIRHLAKKHAPNYSFQDDLYQEGILGLLDAIKYFNLTASNRLSTFAYNFIKGRMLNWLIKESKHNHEQYIENTPHSEGHSCSAPEEGFAAEGDGRFYPYVVEQPSVTTPEVLCLQKQLDGIFINMLMTLSGRQRQVLYLVFWKDYRPAEIADTLKISRPRVTALLSSGLRGLKKEVQLAA